MAGVDSSRPGRHSVRPGGNRPRTHLSSRSTAKKSAVPRSQTSVGEGSRRAHQKSSRSKQDRALPASVGGDSLARQFRDARERWEGLREVLDVTQAALEAEEGSLVIEAAANVLFRFVLSPMQAEIRWLDEQKEGEPGKRNQKHSSPDQEARRDNE